MESVIFQLHPDWLENPDADLRYLISEELEKLSNDELTIVADGYEYDDEDEYMYIFVMVTDSYNFLKVIKRYLSSHKILDNEIIDSCILAQRTSDGYEVLYRSYDNMIFKAPPQ
jgi:hypothetical protein